MSEGRDTERPGVINNVPIKVRPQRREVDVFDDEHAKPPKTDPGPFVAAGAIVLVVIIAGIVIAFVLSMLLSKGDEIPKPPPMEPGHEYAIVVAQFEGSDALQKAEEVVAKLKSEHFITRSQIVPKGDAQMVLIHPFKQGEESEVEFLFQKLGKEFPKLELKKTTRG